jgi:hypothetical protein
MAELEPSSGLWMWHFVFERSLGFSGDARWDAMPEFKPAILKVVNCAVDKDTVGVVACALLGAYWGERGIPEKWRAQVEKAEEIVGFADGIMAAGRLRSVE